MSRTSSGLLALLCLVAAGCGGGEERSATTPTPTASPDPTPAAGTRPEGGPVPSGIRLAELNAARGTIVRACRKPAAVKPAALRAATTVLLDAYEVSPGERFRSSPKAPAVSMRDRLLSLALLGRKDCADQPAGRATRRLAKATSREAGGSADKAKRPRRKARKRKDGAGGTATPSPPPASTPAPTSTPVPAAPEAEE